MASALWTVVSSYIPENQVINKFEVLGLENHVKYMQVTGSSLTARATSKRNPKSFSAAVSPIL